MRSSGVALKTLRYACSGVRDRRADALDEPRPIEDLLGERRRGVIGAQHRQPRSRVARRNAEQVLEQIVEDLRVDGLRSEVDDVGARIPQPDQQEQQAAPRSSSRPRAFPISDWSSVIDGTTTVVRGTSFSAESRRQTSGQARFEPVERGQFLLEGEVAGVGRMGITEGPD